MVARKDGSHLERLQWARNLLIRKLDVKGILPRDAATVVRELRAVLSEIDTLEKLRPRESLVDELGAARNARRVGNPAGAEPAASSDASGTP